MPISRLIVNIRYAVVQLNKVVEKCRVFVVVVPAAVVDVLVAVAEHVAVVNSEHVFNELDDGEEQDEEVKLLWERQELNVDGNVVVVVAVVVAVVEEMAVKEVCCSCCCCCCVNL